MVIIDKTLNEFSYLMAPFNPNVNGIYYTDDSHKQVLFSMMRSDTPVPVYNKYKHEKDAEPIGVITNVSLTTSFVNNKPKLVSGIVDINITVPYYGQFNPDDFVCGFAFEAHPDKYGEKTYVLDSVEYAVLINKQDIGGVINIEFKL